MFITTLVMCGLFVLSCFCCSDKQDRSASSCMLSATLIIVYAFSIYIITRTPGIKQQENPAYPFLLLLVILGVVSFVGTVFSMNLWNVTYGKTEKEMNSYQKKQQFNKLARETTCSRRLSNIASFLTYSYPDSELAARTGPEQL